MQKAEIEVKRAEGNPLATPLIKSMRAQIAEIAKDVETLDVVNRTFQIKGRHHYSKAQLQEHRSMMESLSKLERDLSVKLNTLLQVIKAEKQS